MGAMRFIVLLIGLALLVAAVLLSLRARREPAPSPVTIEVPAPSLPVIDTQTEVLVAATALPIGHTIVDRDLAWRKVTAETVQADMVKKSDTSDAPTKSIGAIVRASIAAGDIIRTGQLLKRDANGFLASLIQPGKRAFAISIDTKGTATAGNFILPNDHVDVIRSYQGAEGLISEVILQNIRILAIGQSVQESGTSTTGETATVEVDLRQAELLSTAQRTGQISLALRGADEPAVEQTVPSELSITIFKRAPSAGVPVK